MELEEVSWKPFTLAPGEIFIQCPYDESHSVTDKRLLYHLQKCRHNYIRAQEAKGLEVHFGYCRFNFTHQVPRVELAFHEKHCRDQFSVLKHMAFHSTTEFSKFKEDKFRDVKSVTATVDETVDHMTDEEQKLEVWDQTCPGSKYDPKTKLQHESTLYFPNCLTRSEKTAFRSEHRKRFMTNLESGQNETLGATSKKETKFVTSNEPPNSGGDANEASADFPSNQACEGGLRSSGRTGVGETNTSEFQTGTVRSWSLAKSVSGDVTLIGAAPEDEF